MTDPATFGQMERAPFRQADATDLDVLWPAVSAAHLFADYAAFSEFHARDPWRVRFAPDGTAAILEPWRENLDILAIRGLWVSSRRFVESVLALGEVAARQGFGRLLSPLIAHEARGPYERAGLRSLEPLVSFRATAVALAGIPDRVPAGVILRRGVIDDLGAILRIDAACFDPFWAYGQTRLAGMLGTDLVSVAELDGQVIGYTLSTVERGSGTLGRIAVAPEHGGLGAGYALLADSAHTMAEAGAHSVSLCTQQANVTAQALYIRVGMRRIPGKLVFLMGDTGSGGR